MLATLVQKPFDRQGWLFEVKWDGWRALAEVTHSGVRLYSRNDRDLNRWFKPLVDALSSMPSEVLLDGELVVLDRSGRSDFGLLQNYVTTGKGYLVYYVFDILWLEGHDLRGLPLIDRKHILQEVLPRMPQVRNSGYFENEGMALFGEVVKHRLEGMVGKDAQSRYVPRRSKSWLKVKNEQRQELVIGGFTGPGGGKGVGQLIFGLYENRRFIYVGHTPFPIRDRALEARLETLICRRSAFKEPPTNFTRYLGTS